MKIKRRRGQKTQVSDLPQIEKNVPIPKRRAHNSSWIILVEKMKLGDSISLPKGKAHSLSSSIRWHNHVTRSDKTFMFRTLEDGNMRMWRIQ